VTKRSGKQRVVPFRFACDKALRYVVDQVAFLSLRSCEWATVLDQLRAGIVGGRTVFGEPMSRQERTRCALARFRT
jgi:hypothetical protein